MFRQLGLLCLLAVTLILSSGRAIAEEAISVIVSPKEASFGERLAAQEIRRYFYLTTDKLVPIFDENVSESSGDIIVVAEKKWPLWKEVSKFDPDVAQSIEALEPEQYLIKTIAHNDRKAILVVGGDSAGVLYGAYRLAEELGVRFYLHGDVVPDGKIEPSLPKLDIVGKPLFAERGIQPLPRFSRRAGLVEPRRLQSLPRPTAENGHELHRPAHLSRRQRRAGTAHVDRPAGRHSGRRQGEIRLSRAAFHDERHDRRFRVSTMPNAAGFRSAPPRSSTATITGRTTCATLLPMEKMPPEQCNRVFRRHGRFPERSVYLRPSLAHQNLPGHGNAADHSQAARRTI